MKKGLLAGLIAMAGAMSQPMHHNPHVEVSGSFSGLKHGPIKNKKPKTMGNHKRSKKRRN